jgi:hypothetical protein
VVGEIVGFNLDGETEERKKLTNQFYSTVTDFARFLG